MIQQQNQKQQKEPFVKTCCETLQQLMVPMILIILNLFFGVVGIVVSFYSNEDNNVGPIDLTNMISSFPSFQGAMIFISGAGIIFVLWFVFFF